MAIYKSCFVSCGMIFFLAVAGCATTDRKLSGQYQPVANATGGTGELYLAVTAGNPMVHEREKPIVRLSKSARPDVDCIVGLPPEPETFTGKWVVIKIKNDRGQLLCTRVSPLASDELFREALKQELNAAGYAVKLVNSLPKNAGKGIDLTRISVDMEQVTALLKDEGTCNIVISLDLWRNGVRASKLNYEARYSDSAIFDRDQFLQTIVRDCLQTLMKQAVPEIVKELNR